MESSLRKSLIGFVFGLLCSALINFRKVKSDPFLFGYLAPQTLLASCPIGVGLMGLQMCKVLCRKPPRLGHSEALTSRWTLNTSSQEARAPSLSLCFRKWYLKENFIFFSYHAWAKTRAQERGYLESKFSILPEKSTTTKTPNI